MAATAAASPPEAAAPCSTVPKSIDLHNTPTYAKQHSSHGATAAALPPPPATPASRQHHSKHVQDRPAARVHWHDHPDAATSRTSTRVVSDSAQLQQQQSCDGVVLASSTVLDRRNLEELLYRSRRFVNKVQRARRVDLKTVAAAGGKGARASSRKPGLSAAGDVDAPLEVSCLCVLAIALQRASVHMHAVRTADV